MFANTSSTHSLMLLLYLIKLRKKLIKLETNFGVYPEFSVAMAESATEEVGHKQSRDTAKDLSPLFSTNLIGLIFAILNFAFSRIFAIFAKLKLAKTC